MTPEVTRSTQLDWKPLVEAGVNTTGISVKVLRFDQATQRAPTFLLKFEAGASYPNHNHPGGEEVFVLEGEVRFGPNQLSARRLSLHPAGSQAPGLFQNGLHHIFCCPGRS
jgi:quercetin dioxygenase-like cupin family protein